MPVFHLSDTNLVFPDPEWAEPEGLLAVGGDLSPERLLLAYRQGIFPWYGEGEPLLWWSPDPRCVLFPRELHVARRLARVMRQGRFRITCNQAFDRVIAACAEVRTTRQQATWLLPEMQEAYRALHRSGFAHSVEAWIGEELAGGLYGVAMGSFFFGESMFHYITDASKVVLASFCGYLAEHGFALFDCQVPNPHLFGMGARNLPRREFLACLRAHAAGAEQPFARIGLPERL